MSSFTKLILAPIAILIQSPNTVPDAETLQASSASPISVSFMARGLEIDSPGHSFMAITISTPRGNVTNAYGFYPREGGMGKIKGPGQLKKEYRCSDAECASLNASVTSEAIQVPITDAERVKIMKLIDGYNSPKLFGPSEPKPEYILTTENCNKFVGEIATALGYPVPSPSQLPTAYVSSLGNLIQIEQARRAREIAAELRRDAEQEAQRANKELEKADRRLEEAKLKEEEAERRERERRRQEARRRKPNGWIRCLCPDKHSNMGRLFNGQRWHQPNSSCD